MPVCELERPKKKRSVVTLGYRAEVEAQDDDTFGEVVGRAMAQSGGTAVLPKPAKLVANGREVEPTATVGPATDQIVVASRAKNG